MPELLHPLHARRATVTVRVHHDLGAAGERLVGHRVHVSDDHVRLPAGLEDRVSATVHADEHRPVLLDVGPEDHQVLLVVVAAHHDEHLAPVDRGDDVRDADAVEQQLALAAQVVHGVGRERLELDGQPRARVLQRRRDGLGVLQGPLGHQPVAVVHLPVETPHGVTLDQRSARPGRGRRPG